MHPNAQLLHDFYEAFKRGDAEGMVACYAPDVEFSDPLFKHLVGAEACGMWRMLLERPAGTKPKAEVVVSGIEADDESGKAQWDADYTFPKTGRKVHNPVDARFKFRDGKIIRHQDSFNLWSWMGQALGLPGKLLGWFPPFVQVVRRSAEGGLRDHLRKRG